MSGTILVFASAEPGAELIGELHGRCVDAETEVLVVVPALASPIGLWTNDDHWRRRADEIVARTTSMLAAAGIASRGQVGDPDPLQALDDAFRSEEVVELIIVHSAAGRTSPLERDLLRCSGGRYAVPVTALEAPEGTPAGAGEGWGRRHGRLATAAFLAVLSALVLAAIASGSGRLLVASALVLAIIAVNVGPKLVAIAAIWLVVRRGHSRRGRAISGR